MKLDDYAFPAPPVYSGAWAERDWLRFARRFGFVRRRGPAPSVRMWDGRYAPFAGTYNAMGEPLYDTSRSFRSPLH